MRHLSERIDVHALYTDFSKAFDMVNHEVLLLKLGKYGLSLMKNSKAIMAQAKLKTEAHQREYCAGSETKG